MILKNLNEKVWLAETIPSKYIEIYKTMKIESKS